MKGAGIWHNGVPYLDRPAQIVDVSRCGQGGSAAPITTSPAGTHVAAEEAYEALAEGSVDVRLDLVLQEG
jgi:hypothetical protein